MSDLLKLDGLASQLAITKPSVAGAAFRIFLLGGSALTEKERAQACGSAFLIRDHAGPIMNLVRELEGRTVQAGIVGLVGQTDG